MVEGFLLFLYLAACVPCHTLVPTKLMSSHFLLIFYGKIRLTSRAQPCSWLVMASQRFLECEVETRFHLWSGSFDPGIFKAAPLSIEWYLYH